MAKVEKKATEAKEKPKQEKKPNCFIIMPITVPESMVDTYRDGKDHFRHVLDTLFFPAVEQAGLKPIPPKVKGGEVIHAEIIKNLDSQKLVLGDMSTLNANVFYELGIRTAVNKPVCLVKDDVTENVPFDTGIINYHTYASALDGWAVEKERDDLTTHITNTLEKGGDVNAMWKYFGVKLHAAAMEAGTVGDQLALISRQIEQLRIDVPTQKAGSTSGARVEEVDFSDLYGELSQILGGKLAGMSANLGDRSIVLRVAEPPNDVEKARVAFTCAQYGAIHAYERAP